jgi:hypothetical protein
MNAEPIDLVWAAHAIALSRDIEEQMTARAAEGFRPVAMPILAQCREFQNGEIGPNIEEIMNECYGAVGYRDGGKRFIKTFPQQPPPQQGLMIEKLKAEIERMRNQGKGALMSGLAAVKKADLGDKALEADQVNRLLDHLTGLTEADRAHHHRTMERHIQAFEMGHKHANELADRLSPPQGAGGAGSSGGDDPAGAGGGMSAPVGGAGQASPPIGQGAPGDEGQPGGDMVGMLREMLMQKIGARQAPDGNHYLPDPHRPGKYLQVVH